MNNTWCLSDIFICLIINEVEYLFLYSLAILYTFFFCELQGSILQIVRGDKCNEDSQGEEVLTHWQSLLSSFPSYIFKSMCLPILCRIYQVSERMI